MTNITIQEFLKIAKKEWAAHNASVNHSEDEFDFIDWIDENNEWNKKKYGISYSTKLDRWVYEPNNKNYKESA
jgi:hypothetical protein